MNRCTIGATGARKKANSINERYFGSVATVDSNGNGGNGQFNEDRDPPEGGISALIIETAVIKG
ncbi:hypothetical protein [Polaromonas sp.]|uniref:hypothetical protein n=1 Tax=Polaromonas sp. TaxID=1869339 RepID=UPI002FC90E03